VVSLPGSPDHLQIGGSPNNFYFGINFKVVFQIRPQRGHLKSCTFLYFTYTLLYGILYFLHFVNRRLDTKTRVYRYYANFLDGGYNPKKKLVIKKSLITLYFISLFVKRSC